MDYLITNIFFKSRIINRINVKSTYGSRGFNHFRITFSLFPMIIEHFNVSYIFSTHILQLIRDDAFLKTLWSDFRFL